MNKTVIIVLVILAVLFITGMSGHFFSKEGGQGDSNTKSDINNFQADGGGMIASIGNSLGIFGERFNHDRIRNDNCTSVQNKANEFRISSTPCAIALQYDSSAPDMVQIEIAVNANVKIMSPMKPPCPAAKTTRALKAQIMKPALVFRPGHVKENTGGQQAQLTIRYEPASGGESGNKICELQQPVKIPVLRGGGTLTLSCKQCAQGLNVQLR